MTQKSQLLPGKFIIAKTKFGATVKVRRINEGKLSRSNIFHSYGEAFRYIRKRYRPAEWKDNKIFFVSFEEFKQ